AAAESGLAGAGFADEADALAGTDLDRGVLQGMDVPAVAALENLADAGHAHKGSGVGSRCRHRRRAALEGTAAQGLHLRANLALADAGREAPGLGFGQRRAGGSTGLA